MNHRIQHKYPTPDLPSDPVFDEIIDTRTNIPMTSVDTETIKSKIDVEL